MPRFNFYLSAVPIALIPAQAGGTTVTSSVYKSLRNCGGNCAIICHISQQNAAPVEIIPLQATNESGAGSKPLGTNSNPPVFFNSNCATGDTLVAQAPAANFTTDASIADKLIIFEFTPADCLDLVNGFGHIGLQIVGSNAANIIEGHMQYLARYQMQVPFASEV